MSLIGDWLDHLVIGQIDKYISAAGASMVTKGLITHDQGTQLIGAVTTIVPILLSAYINYQRQQTQNAALLAAAKLPFKQGVQSNG